MSLFEFSALSEQGLDPDGNDDFVAMDPELGAFVIADGMGGRPGGSQASTVAAETFLEYMRRLDAPSRLDESSLRGAVAVANSAVRSLGETNPMLSGLGTTLSAVVLDGPRGKTVHVGDSRIYRFGAGRLERLTRDHTLVAELVERNELSAEAAKRHPLRNVLSRSLGMPQTVEPDICDLELGPEDWLMLTTDGLAAALSEEDLSGILRECRYESAEGICTAVMDAAMANEPEDNVTVAAVRLKSLVSAG
ncbi:MAG: hypothetical protein A2Y61_02850 [Chloroflexi bacterium RBG_13_60_13]|nr:MAG: hypothetical protein A2Y61_02850 [Chloroflexi bacterium RBG_13_60_13]